MDIPLQVARITGFTSLLPTQRNLLFFSPVLNEYGRLVDLQQYMPGRSAPGLYLAGTCLSDWIVSGAAALPVALCEQLENGIVCQLTCLLDSSEEGQLLITPIHSGYLVEVTTHTNAGSYTEIDRTAQFRDQQPADVSSGASESAKQPEPAAPLNAVNELLEAIVTNTPVGLALLRPVWEAGELTDFRYLWANPAHAALGGHTISQLSGQRFKTLHPSASSAGLFGRLAEVAQQGTRLHYKKEIKHDGLSYWGEFTIIRVGENVLFTMMDISPLMKAKSLLRDKNAQLEQLIAERTKQVRDLSTLQSAILRYAGQAIVFTDDLGIVRTVNQATESLMGYTAHELVGQAARMQYDPTNTRLPVVVIGPYEAVQEYSPFFRPLLAEQSYVQRECVLVNKSGHLVSVLLTVSRLEDEAGGLIGYISIATDISAVKRVEAELRQKNQLLDTFFAGALDMHCITDRKGYLLEVNHAFENAMGYTAAELRTIPLMSLIHPEERIMASRKALKDIQHQPVHNQINRWRRKDGSYRIVEWSAIGVDGLVYGSARDITDRQAAEDQLRWLHERLQLATDAAGQGIWENDLVNGRVLWDERLWAIHGLSLPVRPLTFPDFIASIHPDDRPALQAKFQQELHSKNDSITNIYRIVKPNGEIRYLETNGRIIRDQDGRPLRLIGVAWDVTRRSLAEESLRASEQRYRSLVDHLDTIVFQTNEYGIWTYLNPAWEVVTGFTIKDSLGGFFLDSIREEDRAETRQLFAEIKAGQRTSVRHVIRYIHKQGGYRWIDVHAHVVYSETRGRIGVTGTLTDITDRKTAEEAILESEQRFREIAENVDEIFWISNEENQFVYANPAFERFSGMAPQVIYKDPLAFLGCIAEEDRTRVCENFFNTGSGTTLTFRAYHQDGSLRWLKARMFSIANEAGDLLRHIGVASDITTAIEKEQILETSLDNERALNSLKSQFLTTASHEFRTPLMSISSSAELIRHYLEQNRIQTSVPLIHKQLDAVMAKVNALNELIGDTLTLSKIEQGKIAVQLEWVDLVALCEALILSTFAERKDHRQVNVLVKGPAVPVFIDPKLMKHVLTNLLTNAIKFSTKSVNLTLSYTQAGVAIVVSDQGIGIPKKDLPHLFDKFFRAGNAINYQGSGLGLAICQEYTRQMRGQIEVSSREGVGTTFTVTIPHTPTE